MYSSFKIIVFNSNNAKKMVFLKITMSKSLTLKRNRVMKSEVICKKFIYNNK